MTGCSKSAISMYVGDITSLFKCFAAGSAKSTINPGVDSLSHLVHL